MRSSARPPAHDAVPAPTPPTDHFLNGSKGSTPATGDHPTTAAPGADQVRVASSGSVFDSPTWQRALQDSAGPDHALPPEVTDRLGTVHAERIPAGILMHHTTEHADFLQQPTITATLRSLAPDPTHLTIIAPDTAATRSLPTLLDALPPQARQNLRLITPDHGTDLAAALLHTFPDIHDIIAANGPVKITDNGYAHALNHDYIDPTTHTPHHTTGQWQRITRATDTPPTNPHTPHLTAEPTGALYPSPAWDQTLTAGIQHGALTHTERIPAGLTLTTPTHTTPTFDPAHLLPDPQHLTLAIHGDINDPYTRTQVTHTLKDLASMPATRTIRLAWDNAANPENITHLQHLANKHNLHLTAPNGPLTLLDSGATMITTPHGQWTHITPHQPPQHQGPLSHPPAWHQPLATAPTHPTHNTQLHTTPSGAWLHEPTTPPHPHMPTPTDIHHLPPHPNAPTLTITTDPNHPTTHQALQTTLTHLTTTPDTYQHINLLFTHPNAD
ncbi:hypothetical protein ACFZCJ_39555, partial [Streptomyces lydicus]